MKIIYSYIVSIVFVAQVCCQKPIEWHTTSQHLSLNGHIMVYEDLTNRLTLTEVTSDSIQKKFKAPESYGFNDATSSNVFWVKFYVNNPDNASLLLYSEQAVLGDFSLYYKDSTGIWQNDLIKNSHPWHKKPVKYQLPNFELPPTSTYYLLRINTIANQVGLHLIQKSELEKKATSGIITFAILLGFMIFIVIYNMFLFFTIRRIEYFFYCVLISGYIIFSIITSGFIHYFITVTDIWIWYKWVPIILQPIGMAYTLVFLEVQKHPKVYRIGLFLTLYFISYWIWNNFLTIVGIANMSQLNALIGMIAMVSIGYYVGKKGNKLGYYFAAAYVMMVLFGTLDILHLNKGYPPNILDINFMTFGFLFEITILSYLLTKRFEWENKAIIRSREEAQHRLVQTTLENERIVKDQNIILEDLVSKRTQELTNSFNELKKVQDQLIQSEKLASLGELTAGIAHEIQNPLNFVNNFSDLNQELLLEMKDELIKGNLHDAKAIADDVINNSGKIIHHGKRADSIVKNMLQHSRTATNQKDFTDINALCDEFLRLAYHGLKAKDKNFNAEFKTDFDPKLPKLYVVSQDLGRVVLNLINNAFYSVNEKFRQQQPDSQYCPMVIISTHHENDKIEIKVKDNGGGIPQNIIDKIYQPFFTTKPTGQGTGLGLSLTYDIIKAHNGEMKVVTKEGEGSQFIISLPIV